MSKRVVHLTWIPKKCTNKKIKIRSIVIPVCNFLLPNIICEKIPMKKTGISHFCIDEQNKKLKYLKYNLPYDKFIEELTLDKMQAPPWTPNEKELLDSEERSEFYIDDRMVDEIMACNDLLYKLYKQLQPTIVSRGSRWFYFYRRGCLIAIIESDFIDF